MTDTLNIFLSHKHEDAETAKAIKEQLTSLAESDKLNVFLSEEISAGEEWLEWIRRSLGDSNLLLLLFTDVTKSWDWCLYEAGLFQDLKADREAGPRRVVCLSGVDEIPGPLKHLQAVRSTPESVTKFLRDLYLRTELTGFERPLSPLLERLSEPLEKAGREISKLIARRPVEQRYFGKFAFIHVADPSALKAGAIPPDASVESSEDSLKALFDKLDKEWEWAVLEAEARKNQDTRWLDELTVAMERFVGGHPPQPMQATYLGRGNKQLYRPVLYRVDSLADGSIVFKVLFHEDVSWQVTDIPTHLGYLVTSLAMATRFRYEVLDKERDGLDSSDAAILERACSSIERAIETIEQEASSRGMLEQQGLVASFGSDEDRAEVAAMYESWFQIREVLIGALKARDGTTAAQQIDTLSGLNRRYLAIATRRFAELMAPESGIGQVAAPRAAIGLPAGKRPRGRPDTEDRPILS